jgi:parallel beta-helix repeat protein
MLRGVLPEPSPLSDFLFCAKLKGVGFSALADGSFMRRFWGSLIFILLVCLVQTAGAQEAVPMVVPDDFPTVEVAYATVKAEGSIALKPGKYALSGITVWATGNPTVSECRIHDGKGAGIRIFVKGMGTFNKNTLSENYVDGKLSNWIIEGDAEMVKGVGNTPEIPRAETAL